MSQYFSQKKIMQSNLHGEKVHSNLTALELPVYSPLALLIMGLNCHSTSWCLVEEVY